jgi:hypothetical protein
MPWRVSGSVCRQTETSLREDHIEWDCQRKAARHQPRCPKDNHRRHHLPCTHACSTPVKQQRCPSTDGPANPFCIIPNSCSFFERPCVHLVHKPVIKPSTEKHLHLASWVMSVVVVRRHRLAGILLDSVVALHPSSDYCRNERGEVHSGTRL